MIKRKSLIEFKSQKNGINLKVQFDKDTVWLSQSQMAGLFDKNVRTINEHIKRIYKEKELLKRATIRKFRIVQMEAGRNIKRTILLYNLDMIISVGYRVNSKRGTQFRIWATKVLRDHLVKGYTANKQRLKELQQTIKLLKKVVDSKKLKSDEAVGLLDVITDYSYALGILDKYDKKSLKINEISRKECFKIYYKEAKMAIDELRKNINGSNLFGNEKDTSFKSSLLVVYQTFDGNELYSSLEEKAAYLLYFIVKNHSFVDGNKRIAAFLFVWFLERNNLLYNEEGNKRIADNALVALTLMIAESSPIEKNMMAKVVVNLINRNN